MNNQYSQFSNAISAVGMQPPGIIEPGKWNRFPGINKSHKNKAGWCMLFDDGAGGVFGDFSSGFQDIWFENRESSFSETEKVAYAKKVKQLQKKAQEIKAEEQDKAAEKAAEIWSNASKDVNEHKYLTDKGIQNTDADIRIKKGNILIPLHSDGKLYSLQSISNVGQKGFMPSGKVKGCYFTLGHIEDARTVCIAEGFSTAASIRLATKFPVVVAFNAGNLVNISQLIRRLHSAATLIICADNDTTNNINIGIEKATEAALSVDAKLAIPTFDSPHTKDKCDFNDLARIHGLDRVNDVINSATLANQSSNNVVKHKWAEPIPLTDKYQATPYPIDALPNLLRCAVEEVIRFTQAPIPLAACSALAATSLACQAHVDVERASILTGPSSLFLLSIADSGERKSSCDGYFTSAIKQFQSEQESLAEPVLKEYSAKLIIWEAKIGGVKDKIRSLTKANKATLDQEKQLLSLEDEKPVKPKVPRLLYSDATPEALKWNLAKVWPSGGILSSEAGVVFGSHGMKKDSLVSNLATLNQLWDGDDIATDRRSSESFTVRNVRLTIALQVQEATLLNFFNQSGDLARGTGFLARFLLAWPNSTQGTRFFNEPADGSPALDEFNERISSILNKPPMVNSDDSLSPTMLALSPDAKKAWVTFHDAIESELNQRGELYKIRDIASKIADNAARISALFQYFESGDEQSIQAETFINASRIAAWHLRESQRFLNDALSTKASLTILLENWIIDYCNKNKTSSVTRREIQRNVNPNALRDGNKLNAALDELVQSQRVRTITKGKSSYIEINPSLLNEIYS